MTAHARDEGRGTRHASAAAARVPRRSRPGRASPDLLPAVLLAALVLFVGAQAWAAHTGPARLRRGAAPSAGSTPARTATDSARAARARRVRTLLQSNAAGTYLGAQLGPDSLLRRWPNGPGTPVDVWVQPATSLEHWHPSNVAVAREAFHAWAAAAPLLFAFTNDSAAAAIRVYWADRLASEAQVGNNRLVYDETGVVVAADVTLAVHDTRGVPLPAAVLRVVALHEVGHAIGLGHSPDPRDVMAAQYDRGTTTISAADAATARLLYALPTGGIGGGR